MPFKKGVPRPPGAGRVKGTPNKKTAGLLEILEAHSFNPVEKLLELYTTTDNEQIKAALLNTLMKYVYPQKKAIEVNGQIDHKLASRIEEIKAMTPEEREAARIKALKLVGSGS